MRLLVYLLLMLSLIGVRPVYANEIRCAAVYVKIMEEIETGNKVLGNSCLLADSLERILNWIGTGEIECADMPQQQEEMKKFKAQYTELLWREVQKCEREKRSHQK